MTAKRTVEDIDLAGKTVLVRVDFNVPFRPGTMEISDDGRVRASIPTIQHLRSRRCRVVLCSHLGRPGGKVVDGMRLAPVSARLSELLRAPVVQAPDCVGADVKAMVDGLEPGGVLMTENTRFHPEEEENDPDFAGELASLAQVYVNDAFGAAHRAHASTEGVARLLPAVAGFLMERELLMLEELLESPESPFVAIMGGAKASDKLAALQRLAPPGGRSRDRGWDGRDLLRRPGAGRGRLPRRARQGGGGRPIHGGGDRERTSTCSCPSTSWWPTRSPSTPPAGPSMSTTYPQAGASWTSAPSARTHSQMR